MTLAIGVLLYSGGCGRDKRSEGFLRQGMQMLEQDDYRGARESFTKAALVQTNSASAYYNLGYSCWKLGDIKAAERYLAKASILSEESTAPAELLAHIMLERGNRKGAERVLSGFENPPASMLTLQASIAWQAGYPDKARSYLSKALEKNPDYAPALYNLAVLYRDNDNDRREALACYKRYRELAPRNPRAAETPQAFLHAAAGGAGAATHTPPQHSTTAENSVTVPGVRERHTGSAPRQSAAERSRREVASALEKVKRELKSDNADTALIILKKIVGKHPDSADAIWALAELYDKNLGNRAKADLMYNKFLVMFPHDPRAATAAGQLNRRTSSSRPVTARGNKTGTDKHYFNAGLKYYSNKQYSKAIEAYRNGLRLNPKSSMIAYNLGLAYKAKADLKNAAKAFRVALQTRPDKMNALYMLGLTELERGNNDAALKYLNRLLRVSPDFAKAHYLLGTVYSKEGRPDMTAIHFERFLKLEPTGKNADQVRSWLKKHKVN